MQQAAARYRGARRRDQPHRRRPRAAGERATYFYEDGDRSWYDTASVDPPGRRAGRRLLGGRRLRGDRHRLRQARTKDMFAAVHAARMTRATYRTSGGLRLVSPPPAALRGPQEKTSIGRQPSQRAAHPVRHGPAPSPEHAGHGLRDAGTCARPGRRDPRVHGLAIDRRRPRVARADDSAGQPGQDPGRTAQGGGRRPPSLHLHRGPGPCPGSLRTSRNHFVRIGEGRGTLAERVAEKITSEGLLVPQLGPLCCTCA